MGVLQKAMLNEPHEIEFGVADDVIEGLRGRLGELKADTAAGYELVKAGISEVRTIRTGVERGRKELKKSAIEWGRKVDGEAKRVTTLLREIEDPLIAEKAKVDDEVARARQEREEAEQRKLDEELKARQAEQEQKRLAEEAELRKQQEAEKQQLKAEQEKLKAEQEKLKQQREEIERERKAIEDEKKVAAEAEEKKRQEEEMKKAEARKQELRKAAAAAEVELEKQRKAEAKRLEKERRPDAEKLMDLAGDIDAAVGGREAKYETDWAKDIVTDVSEDLSDIANRLRDQIQARE